MTQPAWTAYTSCETLPLTVFIDCLVDGAYQKLLLTGQMAVFTPDANGNDVCTLAGATMDEMAAVWMGLYEEYSDLTEDVETAATVNLLGEMAYQRAKVIHIETLLKLMERYSHPKVAEMLACWGLRVTVHEFVADSAMLSRALAMLKGEKFKLSELEREARAKKGEKARRLDFVEHMMHISKFEGFRLTVEGVTVAEYCIYVKRLRQHYELMLKNPELAHAG